MTHTNSILTVVADVRSGEGDGTKSGQKQTNIEGGNKFLPILCRRFLSQALKHYVFPLWWQADSDISVGVC